jgi:hypothetical protein
VWVHSEVRGRLEDRRKVLFAFGQWGWCRVDVHEHEPAHEPGEQRR